MNTIYERTCIVCGNDFTAKQYTAKTCSQECRNILSLSRKIIGNAQVDDQPDVITPVTTPAITPVSTKKPVEKAKENLPLYNKLFHKDYHPKNTKK